MSERKGLGRGGRGEGLFWGFSDALNHFSAILYFPQVIFRRKCGHFPTLATYVASDRPMGLIEDHCSPKILTAITFVLIEIEV